MSRLLRYLNIGRVKIAVAVLFAVVLTLAIVDKISNNNPPIRQGEVSLDPSSPDGMVLVKRGEALAQQHCARCHGPDLRGMTRDSAGEEVSLGANITDEGRCSTYTTRDFCRAVREGLRPDSTPISRVMPAIATQNLSDQDIQAIWMYSQNAPENK